MTEGRRRKTGARTPRRGVAPASETVHQILERVAEGFVAFDKDWRYTYVNEKAAQMLGRRAEELLGAHAWTEFPDAVGGPIHGALEQAMATQQPGFVEAYFEPWDRWFENRIYPSESGLSIFFSDITERKRAESALEQAHRERERLHSEVEAEKRRFERLAACVPAGILMVEAPSGRLIFSNQRAAEMLGDPERLQRSVAQRLAAPPAANGGRLHPLDVLAVAMSTGVAALDEEITCVREGEERLTLLVSAVPVQGASGAVEAAVASFHDVSERRLARDTLRQLSRRLLAVQEEERGRISRDLHDDLGQVLTGVKMSLGSMARRVRSAALLAALADAIESVDRGLAWTRDLSLQLHPPMLDLLGLGATLRWYLEERKWQGPPLTHLSVEIPDARLPRVIETTCFRVTQEAVTNVLRHARARNLWVDARNTPEGLQLSVRDDGCGFDVSAARAQAAAGTSAGLSGMRERVALARGRLEVLSRPGTGTQVTVRFPLRAVAVAR
jgi:PAS domain S-box-containing protein